MPWRTIAGLRAGWEGGDGGNPWLRSFAHSLSKPGAVVLGGAVEPLLVRRSPGGLQRGRMTAVYPPPAMSNSMGAFGCRALHFDDRPSGPRAPSRPRA